MKNKAKYQIFIIVTLLLVGCKPGSLWDKNDNPPEKVEYKNKLEYFTDRYGQRIYKSLNQNHGFYITLPECFQPELYKVISLTEQFTYLCGENSTYITVDPISEKDISYYKAYFENKSISTRSNTEILRDYVMEVRDVGLTSSKKSVHSTIKTDRGKKMLLGTVVGRANSSANELSYQYAVIYTKEHYYILQAITKVSNFKYLRQDILKIFKTFSAR